VFKFPDSTIHNFRGEYAFLSNFYWCWVYMGGIVYPTVEHYFQAHKANDLVGHRWVAGAVRPDLAKKRGRAVVNLRPSWDEDSTGVMLDGLRAKFSVRGIRKRLLLTGDRELVEGNSWGDEIWGVDRYTGRGENRLGKLLMQVREEMRADG
jgi:ribA/ribD-fused uncharacterized protein